MRTTLIFLNSVFYLEMQEQNKQVRRHALYCITCSLTKTSDILINRLIYVSYWILYFSRKTRCSSNIYRSVSLGKSTASVCMYMCSWRFHFNIYTESEMTFTKPYMLNTVNIQTQAVNKSSRKRLRKQEALLPTVSTWHWQPFVWFCGVCTRHPTANHCASVNLIRMLVMIQILFRIGYFHHACKPQ